MRKFEFRVFDPESRKMEQVGALDWDYTCSNIITCNTLTQKLYRGYHADSNFILMQFTGLTDINDKKIYENDIVALYKQEGVVVYKQCVFIVEWYKEGKINYKSYLHECGKLKIIGNICENPEIKEL